MINRMWDAAYPPGVFPAGFSACAGYAGGDALNTWSDADWQRAGQAGLRGLPIWVRSDPAGVSEGRSDGQAFASWLTSHEVPSGCLVALDRETSVDLAYVEGFAAATSGWRLLEYGSPGNLFTGAGSPYGYWPANPAAFQHWDPVGLPYSTWPGATHAVQCVWETVYDISLVGPHALARMWKVPA